MTVPVVLLILVCLLWPAGHLATPQDVIQLYAQPRHLLNKLRP